MPVQAGSTIALKVLDVRPADGAQPPAAMPETGADGTPILTGTVARNNAHGQPILATPRGTFLLATPLPVQQGTQMTVALTDPAQILAAGLPHGEDEAGGGKGWPDFQRALATLAAIDPAMAQALVNTVMPQPNRKLGTALMFFLSAARGGDARGWLGDEAALTLEKSGRRDVLTALTEEFRAMARQAADTPPGEWKPYLIPFLAGETVARLSLHVRPVGDEDGQKGGRDKEGRGSRFLLDVDLSRLGPIQLDGLVRPRRFDLILRSRIDLPEEVRHDLPTIFTNCLETVGYTGALSFQSGGRGWVSVQPKPSRGLGPHGAGVSA
ncbi:MAG TPA: hypothetical protein VEB64_13280 [Azospirillaceae bacterium]|nr:hypothetical protein [Azospirillaceae bacterium]